MKRSISVLLITGLWVVGCSTPPSPKSRHYEYKTVSAYVESDLEKQINALAKDGWRVVSSTAKDAPELKGFKTVAIMERSTP
jgi:hypothetical protein